MDGVSGPYEFHGNSYLIGGLDLFRCFQKQLGMENRMLSSQLRNSLTPSCFRKIGAQNHQPAIAETMEVKIESKSRDPAFWDTETTTNSCHVGSFIDG